MLYPMAICLSVRIKLRFSWTRCIFTLTNHISAGNYMSKVNNRNTRTRCKIFSKLTIKTPEQRQFSGVQKCGTGLKWVNTILLSVIQDTQKKANWFPKFKSSEIQIIYLWEGVQPVRILYVEKPHHCFVSSKILQPKIYLRSFYDSLLLLRTDYSVTMTSYQGKKKWPAWCFCFIFTKHRKKRDFVLLYIFVFRSIDSKVLSKLTTCK